MFNPSFQAAPPRASLLAHSNTDYLFSLRYAVFKDRSPQRRPSGPFLAATVDIIRMMKPNVKTFFLPTVKKLLDKGGQLWYYSQARLPETDREGRSEP